VQGFQMGPLFPTQGSSEPPHSYRPVCTARLARPIAILLVLITYHKTYQQQLISGSNVERIIGRTKEKFCPDLERLRND